MSKLRHLQSKYKNQKHTVKGRSFDSGLERWLFVWLQDRMRRGEIRDIKQQDSVKLSLAAIEYRADFRVTENDGSCSWHEAKGYETAEWRIKRRLWKHYGPGPLTVYVGSQTRFYAKETIIPEAPPVP